MNRAMQPCQPLYRLFYALRPPADAAAAIEHETAWLGRRRRVRRDMLHVTLNIIDDWPCRPLHLIEAMTRLGSEIAANPFRVVFDQLSGGTNTIVLRPSERIEALHGLQRLLERRLTRTGIARRAGTRFNPHLTLVHRGRPDLHEAANPVSWRVEEFMLIESLVGWTEHRVLGRWPLS